MVFPNFKIILTWIWPSSCMACTASASMARHWMAGSGRNELTHVPMACKRPGVRVPLAPPFFTHVFELSVTAQRQRCQILRHSRPAWEQARDVRAIWQEHSSRSGLGKSLLDGMARAGERPPIACGPRKRLAFASRRGLRIVANWQAPPESALAPIVPESGRRTGAVGSTGVVCRLSSSSVLMSDPRLPAAVHRPR